MLLRLLMMPHDYSRVWTMEIEATHSCPRACHGASLQRTGLPRAVDNGCRKCTVR